MNDCSLGEISVATKNKCTTQTKLLILSLFVFLNISGLNASERLSDGYVELFCSIADSGEYSALVEELQLVGHTLTSVWDLIDCRKVNYPGPSLLHLALEDRNSTLTRDLAVGLFKLDRQGIESDIASQLNGLVNYNGRGRTILDRIQIAIMGTSSVTSKNEHSSAEKVLRGLGAKTSEELDAANE